MCFIIENLYIRTNIQTVQDLPDSHLLLILAATLQYAVHGHNTHISKPILWLLCLLLSVTINVIFFITNEFMSKCACIIAISFCIFKMINNLD